MTRPPKQRPTSKYPGCPVERSTVPNRQSNLRTNLEVQATNIRLYFILFRFLCRNTGATAIERYCNILFMPAGWKPRVYVGRCVCNTVYLCCGMGLGGAVTFMLTCTVDPTLQMCPNVHVNFCASSYATGVFFFARASQRICPTSWPSSPAGVPLEMLYISS